MERSSWEIDIYYPGQRIYVTWKLIILFILGVSKDVLSKRQIVGWIMKNV